MDGYPAGRRGARTLLETELAEAERALTTSAGNRSLCEIGASRQSAPSAKHWEGAVSALAETRRRARRDGVPDSPEQLLRVALSLQDRWRTRASEMGPAGADWAAYFRGGIEALDRLAEVLRGC